MKLFIIRLLAFTVFVGLLCLLLAVPARSDDTVTVNAEGYAYHDGAYWLNDLPYAREWIAGTTGYYYYSGCCRYYYPGTAGYYRYYRIPYVKQAAKVSYTSPDWRSQLLSIAQQRDKFELAARSSAIEQANFERAVGVLGLTGNFRVESYGQAVQYPLLANASYGSLQYGSYGAQSNTVYGYTLKQATDLYGATDLNALYQQVAQTTKNAQTLAGQAHTDLSDLAGQAGTNAARVAEILAKAQAAAVAMSAANAAPSQKTESRVFSFRVGPDGAVTTLPAPATPVMPAADEGAALAGWRTFATATCATCHSGATPKAGLNILDYPSFTQEKTAEVWARMLLPDGDPKRMPPAPAARVSPEQFRLWMLPKK